MSNLARQAIDRTGWLWYCEHVQAERLSNEHNQRILGIPVGTCGLFCLDSGQCADTRRGFSYCEAYA